MKRIVPREIVLELAAAAAARIGCSAEEVLGRRRHGPILWARRVVVRQLDGLGYGVTAIGRALKFDHSSIHNLLASPAPKTIPPEWNNPIGAYKRGPETMGLPRELPVIAPSALRPAPMSRLMAGK